MNDEANKTFTPGPVISFWGGQKLSSYLKRAKLYSLERSTGSFKCNGKHCQESNTFFSWIDKKEYVINHSFYGNDKCIIYSLIFNEGKLWYVGIPVNNFCLWWNIYKYNNRKWLKKEACMQHHIFEHFSWWNFHYLYWKNWS